MANGIHEAMYRFAGELFPIARSLTGEGVKTTLRMIQQQIPALEILSFDSGEKCFDWEVPLEWNIHDAKLYDEQGHTVIDYQAHNLHVVGYSQPVDQVLELSELQHHLFSLPDQPDAIPYVTSYYKPFWGFCLTERQRSQLKDGKYRAVIKSTLLPGKMHYGELRLRGKTDREVFLSTYICHPSMGNNEVSGPTVTTYLAKYLLSLKSHKYSYRIIFIPETIGAIAYLSRNLAEMKPKVDAGFVVTCVGDDREYSYLASRKGGTLADRVACHTLSHQVKDFKRYSFRERGSDERQYCSPGVDLPVASIMRSKYSTYKEYHTSLDDMNFISASGLGGAYDVYRQCIENLENNSTFRATSLCEPQLGKRGLYPQVSTKHSTANTKLMMDVLAYSDGKTSLLELADEFAVPMSSLVEICVSLQEAGLLESLDLDASQHRVLTQRTID